MHIFIYLVCNIYLFILAAPGLSCGVQTLSCSKHAGPSSLTRNHTWAPCAGRAESYPLDHQGSPIMHIFRCQCNYMNYLLLVLALHIVLHILILTFSSI